MKSSLAFENINKTFQCKYMMDEMALRASLRSVQRVRLVPLLTRDQEAPEHSGPNRKPKKQGQH